MVGPGRSWLPTAARWFAVPFLCGIRDTVVWDKGRTRLCQEPKKERYSGIDIRGVRNVLPKSSVLLHVSHGQKDWMQRIFIKECFLFVLGSACHVKRFHPDDYDSCPMNALSEDSLETEISWTELTPMQTEYTWCFTTLGHNCRRWFPRSLWSNKFL
jgi:hypothetical protein